MTPLSYSPPEEKPPLRRLRPWAVAFLLTAAAGSSLLPADTYAQEQPAIRLDLQEAVALALELNPRVMAARSQVIASQAQVQSAFGRLLPTLSLSAFWNFAERVQTIPNPFAALGGPTTLTIDFTQDYQGSVNLDLPLWTWGATRSGYQDARTGLEAARRDTEAHSADVTLDVTRAFYGVLLAQRGVEVARDALTQAEHQELIASQLAAQGAASEFEHLRARVQATNLRPGVVRAEAGLRQAHISLNLLLGLDPDIDVEVEGALTYEVTDLDLDALKSEALQRRPDLWSTRLMAQRAELGVRMARATRLPTLLVNGTYGFRADNALLSDQFNDNYSANLILAFPIFDGFAAVSRTRQAAAARDRSRILVDQMERAVLAEVEQAWSDMRAAEESYLAQADNVRVAERALEIAQVSFENGIITGVELNDSQLALTVARQNQYQTLYDYRVALARIRRAAGRPLP